MMSAPRTEIHSFFVSCPRNTEGLVLDELRSLGAADATETRAGVGFSGSLALAYRVCLWSRTASRVLLRLTSFPMADVNDLYAAVHELPWEDHLGVTGSLAVEVTSAISQGPLARLNTHFAEQRVKDAVVDRFREKSGNRPGVDLARPDVRINIHLAPTEAIVSLDLSGDGLHRRGYRLETGEAPLRENLAAAVLLRAGWPRIAAAGGTLLDPMCGSGTLLIEGAWMAGDMAPGLLRDYHGFLGWKGFEPAPWRELVEEAQHRRDVGLASLPPIFGYDMDQKAIATARSNARRAGLAGRLILERRELAALVLPIRPTGQTSPSVEGGEGLVATNPPYGKRLGDIQELVPTYETLGERLKKSFSGWQAAVLTGNPELGAHLGLRAHRLNTLFNGPIECKLLLFHIGIVHSRVESSCAAHAADVQNTSPSDDQTQSAPGPGAGAEMFENRLRKNLKHLRKWAIRDEVHCYRLYDADLPEYALALDVYEDWAHVQEYAPPSTVDPVRARRRLKEALAVVPKALEISPDHVVLKVRSPQRGPDQYQKLDTQANLLEVRESGLRFLVNLTDYLDTGLFLDHRLTRQLIRELAPGGRFLNLFAYTGSATVYAAAGGAIATTTVDLSLSYLDWARRNLALNGFTGAEHSFVRADCLEWFAKAAASADTYDLIFLDAPTFSNSKSMSNTLDIQRDHPHLIHEAAHLLSPGGVLLFSTNFRRFKLDPALMEELTVVDITRQTLPPDFSRNPRIHKCLRITRATPRVDAPGDENLF
jgi:23S rRNA (guanine2445-N2)-methyltransferase / 23S rRNA (guanine2069-N7)-methyltransferase